ncbi:hypothetical protein BT69DRAFT_589044 [Atractiella rhizophila]|nr:hypothetical protein BT69DRAFT_589044 [Atractiella rhizophila]
MLYGGPATGREYSTSNWECGELASEKLNGQAQTDILNQQFHLMALPFVRPLSTFKNGHELLVGILGALQGIVELNRAGILHRDISTGNVVLTSNNKNEEIEALVQDFDVAIKMQGDGDKSRERTGTWMFISAQRIAGQESHTLSDDFESIYHMLSVLTYAHITETVIPQLDSKIIGYLGSTSADLKINDMTGQANGFKEDEIIQIDIFGPIIILFRLFLSTRYARNPDPKSVRYDIAKECCTMLDLSDIDNLLTPFLQRPTDKEKAIESALWHRGKRIKIVFDSEEACQCLINVIKAALLQSSHVDALKRMDHLRPDLLLQYMEVKPSISSFTDVSTGNVSNVNGNKRIALQQAGPQSKVQRTATTTSSLSKPDPQAPTTTRLR